MDNVASKYVHGGFASSVQKLRHEKRVPSTSTRECDETIQNYNMERNVHNTYGPNGMCQMDFENWSLSKVKRVGLSKRNIPSTINSQHGDLNTENNTIQTSILWTNDQCQMEPRKFVQRRLVNMRIKNLQFLIGT
jgi:hypothetical protein